jgi:phosphoenolpyruvate synthase/pyruvate phosphate dikinase
MEIYSFGLGEPNQELTVDILGGKGAGLVWMDSKGVNVPPGFILPTTVWGDYKVSPSATMLNISEAVNQWMQRLKDKFGFMPLVSVRSGARVSCPGMMDTILNVGLDPETRAFWRNRLGDACVDDSEMRLIEMYASVVKGVDKAEFKTVKTATGARQKYIKLTGEKFPFADKQLLDSIEAVFKSWDNDRAKIYRKLNDIPDAWGTAVTVQAMVFGNLNDKSGTGVLFTRNTQTGADGLDGEFLVNAQGEDVVAGVRTPIKLDKMAAWNENVAFELLIASEKLESARGDVQDIEFTIEDGELYILQTRTAKRSPQAAVKIAVDLYNEGVIDAPTLYQRVSIGDWDRAQQVIVEPGFDVAPVVIGLSACPGVATGIAVHTAAAAIDCNAKGVACILVTEETNPDDIGGMFAAAGIVTMTGGSTCHAAVVARGMNKPCIVGVGTSCYQFPEGETISIDGTTGRIWAGEIPVIDGTANPAAREYLELIRTTLNYVPIVDTEVQGVYASELCYHPSASILNLAATENHIDSLLNHCDRLYIDLRPQREDNAEKAFYELFESPAQNSELAIQHYLGTLSDADRERITLIGGTHSFSGVKTMQLITDLKSLVLAEGPALMGALDIYDPAVRKVLDWHAHEIQLVTYGHLNVGPGKSFLSDVQALQTR